MALWQWQHGARLEKPVSHLKAVDFDSLPGWQSDCHASSLIAFHKSAQGLSVNAGLARATEAAGGCNPYQAKEFFERFFTPYAVEAPDAGLLTGYFEPELEADYGPAFAHSSPIYTRPPDLSLAEPDDAVAQRDPPLTAGRRLNGELAPYFTRAEIDAGALRGQNLEIAYAADAIDLFVMHVQGGGLLKLPDSQRRVTFAGKNGHPYTSIAKALIARGELDPENATLDKLLEWMRANTARAGALMQENQSYIFFEMLPEGEAAPRGSSGAMLTAGRSLAIDPSFHTLGLPIWVAAPDLEFDGAPFCRLTIGQDTGSAIRGAARGDIFCGTGAQAGLVAGRIKHKCKFFSLAPKPD